MFASFRFVCFYLFLFCFCYFFFIILCNSGSVMLSFRANYLWQRNPWSEEQMPDNRFVRKKKSWHTVFQNAPKNKIFPKRMVWKSCMSTTLLSYYYYFFFIRMSYFGSEAERLINLLLRFDLGTFWYVLKGVWFSISINQCQKCPLVFESIVLVDHSFIFLLRLFMLLTKKQKQINRQNGRS